MAQRAPSLEGMTPQDITDALFNRIMVLHEAGRQDSVQFLALNMAFPAFQLHDSLTLELRYDLGRIAEVSGTLDIAKAQSDTILQKEPAHLLGLALAASLARGAGDSTSALAFDRRLIAAEAAELKTGREEYTKHQKDIARALEMARRTRDRTP